jgi:hypothetical protein
LNLYVLPLGSRATPWSFFEGMAPMIDTSKRTGGAIEAHEETNEKPLCTLKRSVPGTSRTSRDVRLESAKWAKADTSQLANYSARPTPSCQGSVTALPSARRLLGRVLINAQIAVPAF